MPEPTRHPAVADYDRAVAEYEIEQLAGEIGYTVDVMAGGTIVLHPPRDPDYCSVCHKKHDNTLAGAVDAIEQHTRAYVADAFGLRR